MQNEFYKLSLSRTSSVAACALFWRMHVYGINAQSETKHMHALVSSLAHIIYCCIVLKNPRYTHNRSLRIIGLKLPRITRHLTPRDDITFTCTSLQVCFMFNVIIAGAGKPSVEITACIWRSMRSSECRGLECLQERRTRRVSTE
jgi:hypothetical protein